MKYLLLERASSQNVYFTFLELDSVKLEKWKTMSDCSRLLLVPRRLRYSFGMLLLLLASILLVVLADFANWESLKG